VNDFDGKIAIAFDFLERRADYFLLSYQEHFDVETSDGFHRPGNLGLWGVITAHCIYRNGQHVRKRLLLHDFNDFTALVLTALRAHPVGQFGLMAIRTFRKTGRLQRIMRAAGLGPLVGVSTFGIRHRSTSTQS
jgi:hypothetical protein